jgi:hypothetical protein
MPTPGERLRAALEMTDLGLSLQRQNLRRRNPDWTEEQVSAAFRDWLFDRPLDYDPNDSRPTRRFDKT